MLVHLTLSRQNSNVKVMRQLVSWSLMSLFSTNMAISETKGHASKFTVTGG